MLNLQSFLTGRMSQSKRQEMSEFVPPDSVRPAHILHLHLILWSRDAETPAPMLLRSKGKINGGGNGFQNKSPTQGLPGIKAYCHFVQYAFLKIKILFSNE